MEEAELAYKHLTRPFAAIDLNALDYNIDFINRESMGKNIRIATKSVRSTELLLYIAERLHNHNGWMTFELSETVALLKKGFDQILIGYPQMELERVEEISQFVNEGRSVVFMVDSIEQWQWLDNAGKIYNVIFEICIDINLSTDFKLIYFGTKRSSLLTVEHIDQLLAKSNSFLYTRIVGLMGYEAQIAGVTDQPVAKWQSPLIKNMKKIAKQKVLKSRRETVEYMQGKGYVFDFVNGGGSGSIDFTVADETVTEITIGSAFYFPALFSKYENLPLQNAVSFGLRVTRQPEEGVIVCHGGGYVASGASGVDKNPEPIWPANLSLLTNEGAGEVQTPLKDASRTVQIGDTVYFKHAKAGELCERFNVLHARRGVDYVGSFKTYRGDGGCYL